MLIINQEIENIVEVQTKLITSLMAENKILSQEIDILNRKLQDAQKEIKATRIMLQNSFAKINN